MSKQPDNNPYSTPSANVDNKILERSSIPKVIGIISLVLATLGILGALSGLAVFFNDELLKMQLKLGFSKNYLMGSHLISLIGSLWAIFIGIKLVKYQDIGRRHFNYYVVYTIILSTVGYFVTQSVMKDMFSELDANVSKAAIQASSITSYSVFIVPIIIIIVAILLNQKRVKDSLT